MFGRRCRDTGRSGTRSAAPARVAHVANRSRRCTRPSLARFASIMPGQETIAGTRTPPSQVEPFAHRNGVNAESGQVSISGPLSDEMTTTVESS